MIWPIFLTVGIWLLWHANKDYSFRDYGFWNFLSGVAAVVATQFIWLAYFALKYFLTL